MLPLPLPLLLLFLRRHPCLAPVSYGRDLTHHPCARDPELCSKLFLFSCVCPCLWRTGAALPRPPPPSLRVTCAQRSKGTGPARNAQELPPAGQLTLSACAGIAQPPRLFHHRSRCGPELVHAPKTWHGLHRAAGRSCHARPNQCRLVAASEIPSAHRGRLGGPPERRPCPARGRCGWLGWRSRVH